MKSDIGGKMRILICDDDKTFADMFYNDINKYFESLNRTVSVVYKCQGFEDINAFDYDVVFMDIELKTNNGIELARCIKQMNPNILIIFISNYANLVFSALSVDIFQFIRKENYKYDLMNVLDQLVRHYDMNFRIILLDARTGEKSICVKDIEYLVSVGHEVVIRCNDEDIIYKGSLRKTIECLCSNDIVQIQKGLAINLRYVVGKTRGKIVCKNNEYIVGRKYKENLKIKYMEYLLK